MSESWRTAQPGEGGVFDDGLGDAAAHAPPPSSICRRLVRSDEVEQHAPEALERIAAVGNHHEVGLVEPAGQKEGKPVPDDVAGVGLQMRVSRPRVDAGRPSLFVPFIRFTSING